jgi:hypothetical protein
MAAGDVLAEDRLRAGGEGRSSEVDEPKVVLVG